MSKEQSQEYRGNGNHKWEHVDAEKTALRLRVPGGWFYTVACTPTASVGIFVPMPEVVKHKV